MKDVLFDPVTREIVMTGSGATSDFVLTDNPSVQNGSSLLASRCAVLGSPMSGVGMEQFMGSHASVATAEMNRWKAMAIADGATLAKWTGHTDANGKLVLNPIAISYL